MCYLVVIHFRLWQFFLFVSFPSPPSPALNIDSVLDLLFSLHFLPQVSPLPSHFNFCHYIYFLYELILNPIPTSTAYEIHLAIFNWTYLRFNIFFLQSIPSSLNICESHYTSLRYQAQSLEVILTSHFHA